MWALPASKSVFIGMIATLHGARLSARHCTRCFVYVLSFHHHFAGKKTQTWQNKRHSLEWILHLKTKKCFEIESRSFQATVRTEIQVFLRSEAEAPILWSLDVRIWLVGKDPNAGKDHIQEERGATKDKMVGWCHWHKGHDFEKTPGDGGQGSLVCCSSWGHKELDTT